MPPHRPPRVVPADFALALLREVEAIGEDPDQVLARLRLPLRTHDLRQGRTPTLPDAQFIQLYRECITLLASQANRERNLPPMNKDEVDLLCHCVITSENLREVILRAARFCTMLGGRAGKLTLTEEGSRAVFLMQTFRLPDSVSGLLADLGGLSFYHRLFSWLIGEEVAIPGLGVMHESRGNDVTLPRLFRHPIFYAQHDNHFSFSAHLLEKPVVRSPQRLVELLAAFPFDVLGGPGSQHSFTEAVEQIMQGQLAREEPIPTAVQFASLFNMSTATLRRRLGDEGTSLRGIRERCRMQLAMELMGPESRLKIAEVALRLGYGSTRTFRRAFRLWSGESPNAYRTRVAGMPGLQQADPDLPQR